MRAVLDTSVVVAGGFAHLDAELAISAASLAELHYGVLVTADATVRAARLQRLALVERSLEPLPVDDKVARSYGVLAAAVTHQGRQPRRRVFDLLIAATAHAYEVRLYTRNPADLRGLEELVDFTTP